MVKASKLCNLRCRYCYEWPELGRRDRLSLDDWARLLESIRWYHEYRRATSGGSFQSRIIWHGGEPLLLPVGYIRAVMELERRILGADAIERGEYFNALQTNLYALSDEALALLQEEPIHLGVSMDVVGGVRVTAAGRETESRVAANLDRLRERGIAFGAIVVLAGHTLEHIVDIYDFWESLGVNVRFLPLFDAPLNTPEAPFAISDAQVLDALRRLFVHWAGRPDRVLVDPFREYLDVVLRHRAGGTQAAYDRRRNGEWALLVNTDGTLYEVMDAYEPAKALGNILTMPVEAILASDAYGASLARDDALRAAVCDGCELAGACSSLPVFESARAQRAGSRCHTAYAMVRFIDDYCRARGLSEAEMRALATAQ